MRNIKGLPSLPSENFLFNKSKNESWIDGLVDWKIAWQIGGLADWQIGRLVDWWIGGLADLFYALLSIFTLPTKLPTTQHTSLDTYFVF